jgi:hypothetical protein
VRFRSIIAFALACLPASFATGVHAEEPAAEAALPSPPPPADLPPPGARTTTIVAGAGTTLVSYGLAVGASFLIEEEDYRGQKDLRIPIAGPWMALGRTGCPTSNPDCSKIPLAFGALLAILDGVAQVGGLAVVGEGLFLKTSNKPTAQKAEGPTVHAVPLNFEKGGVGLGVIGTF